MWGGQANPELNRAMAVWAAKNIWPGGNQHFGNCVCMGVMEQGQPVACMVYHNWMPEAELIEISGASIDRRWLTRPVLKAMFDYPFIDLKCQMVVMRVSAAERQSHLHRILAAYGFERFTIPRLLGRNEDMAVFTLTDDAWRKNKFNRGRKDIAHKLSEAA